MHSERRAPTPHSTCPVSPHSTMHATALRHAHCAALIVTNTCNRLGHMAA